MEMTVTEFGDRAVRVTLVGDLDICGAEQLGLPLSVLAGSAGALVVDMTRVGSITAIGICHLVLAARALGRRRGRVFLLDPNSSVSDMLMTVGVDDLLPIVRSEHVAAQRSIGAQAVDPRPGMKRSSRRCPVRIGPTSRAMTPAAG
jgi:anti-anti-sigma factor